jgi:hypothetical protein
VNGSDHPRATASINRSHSFKSRESLASARYFMF